MKTKEKNEINEAALKKEFEGKFLYWKDIEAFSGMRWTEKWKITKAAISVWHDDEAIFYFEADGLCPQRLTVKLSDLDLLRNSYIFQRGSNPRETSFMEFYALEGNEKFIQKL